MKKAISLFVFVSFLWSIVHGQELSNSISFNVKNIKRNIVVDGILKKEEWALIDSIAGLSSPWSSIDHDQTVFKSFCSDSCFYFCFNVADKTITTYDFKEKLTVAKEDRVELFFSATSDLSQYFCIEMDPLGRINDYSAQYYRKFDRLWNFNQLDIATTYTPQGYIVEGSISLSELEKLGIKESFFLGIFRADFKSTKADDVVWFSWIKPKSPTPDFHIPSALGMFNLMKR